MGLHSEVSYAKMVVDWLESNQGWTTYKEVDAPNGSGRTIDIYAIQGDPDRPRRTLGVEVKTSFSLRVMEQAEYWKRYTDKTAVAVPEATDNRSRYFASKVCKEFGLGVILVPETEEGPLAPYIDVRARKTGKVEVPELHEAYRKREAGSAGSDPSLGFLQTESQLREVAEELPGIRLLDAIEKIDHHYKTRGSAFSSLRSATFQGIRTKTKEGRTYLYPMPEE